MTPKDAFKWPPKRRESWIQDRHLRTGFLLGLPAFIIATLYAQTIRTDSIKFWTMFSGAVTANAIWLTYSAWSRERDLHNREA
jgi:hypothetical protein